MKRCVNIDWLEVYVLEDFGRYPCDAEYFRKQGYFVREREYGTRVYNQMFTILDDYDQPDIEIRRDPSSMQGRDGGLFPPNSCHIRLSNRACYQSNPVAYLRDFLARHNYTFKKIFRLDVCLDFEHFDKGDDPQSFIRRYMKGVYAKVNQGNISAHGTEQWNGREWNSLSWGKPKSMVGTKLYCKTLELEQASDKPYIRQAWWEFSRQCSPAEQDCILIDDPINMTKRGKDGKPYKPAIWRVEFSIKSSAQRWFVIDRAVHGSGKIVMPHTLSLYDSKEKLLKVFASLAEHYFHFKYYDPDTRKDRCKDKILFNFSPLDTFYKVDRLASHKSDSKPFQRLLTLLRNYMLMHVSAGDKQAIVRVIDMIETDILRMMKNPNTTQAEVLALRQVMKERIAGIRDKSVTQRIAELTDIINNSPDLF